MICLPTALFTNGGTRSCMCTTCCLFGFSLIDITSRVLIGETFLGDPLINSLKMAMAFNCCIYYLHLKHSIRCKVSPTCF